MKHLCTFIICCLLTSVCHSQEMTLQECIKTGIANNLSLANARINIDKASTGISQSRSRLLPVINGLLQMTDFVKNPVNVTTGTLLGNDFPDNPTWQTIKSMPYNASAGIQLSIPLYNQTILSAIDLARVMKDINSLSYEKAVEDLSMQIAKIYYLAQASQEQIRLTDENIERMDKLCAITAALYEQGVIMEVDLNRVRINLKNLNMLHDQCLTLHNQQLNILRFLINLPSEAPLKVSKMEEEIYRIHNDNLSESLPELLLPAQQKKLALQRIKVIKAGYLPSVSLTGYAGALGYQEKFGNFFHTSAASDNWFGNCYIGLSIKIPLFEANSRKLQIKQYKYDVLQAENRFESTRKELSKNFANARLQFNHNMKVFQTQSENRRQAENVYNTTEEQYKEGVASMTALLQDEMQLRTAQTACVEAICQCRLAQLDLLKLSGNISQLSR